MHVAAQHGMGALVKYLNSNGGKLDAQDRNGNTPMHIASMCGFPSCVTELINLGAKTTVSNRAGKRPADVAANKLTAAAFEEGN